MPQSLSSENESRALPRLIVWWEWFYDSWTLDVMDIVFVADWSAAQWQADLGSSQIPTSVIFHPSFQLFKCHLCSLRSIWFIWFRPGKKKDLFVAFQLWSGRSAVWWIKEMDTQTGTDNSWCIQVHPYKLRELYSNSHAGCSKQGSFDIFLFPLLKYKQTSVCSSVLHYFLVLSRQKL